MKQTALFLFIACALALTACSGTNDSGDSDVRELVLNKQAEGQIDSVGDVDWFHYHALQANSILKVRCTSNEYRPDVELVLTAYEQDDTGKKVRLFADQAPEQSQLPADIHYNLFIDRPKDLYFAVRDLMDDETSANPYYVSVDFETGDEGNDHLTDATPITVDDSSTCRDDSIGSIADVDCFSFHIAADGVYAVNVDFTPFAGGTDVVLNIDLYDESGDLIQTMSGRKTTYRLQSYLTAGNYFVVINDVGKDDFDTASTYTVCVASVSVDEQNTNDTRQTAVDAAYDAATQTYTLTGSLDYAGDVDWYRLDLSTIAATGFKVLDIRFDDDDNQNQFNYQINLVDTTGTRLWSHDFVGGSTAYLTQINSGEGDHYLSIQAAEGYTVTQPCPFSATIQVIDVDDPAETMTHTVNTSTGATATGNNSIAAAIILSPGSDYTTGKIGFRGDEDWYQVVLTDTHRPQILDVYLDTQSIPTNVEYYFSIIRDSVLKKVYDDDATVAAADLKTSILIPAMNTPGPTTYYIRVADYQGDEGDSHNAYRIRADVSAIPVALPHDAASDNAVYYSEEAEITDETATEVELDYTSLDQRSYAANTTLLDVESDDVIRSTDGTVTTLTFPWIGGYMDYQGDQDWFQIPLKALAGANGTTATQWYYTIQIEMHVGGAGSAVEYVWRFYRDRNNNNILVERANDPSGFFASAGDSSPDTISPLDITTPSETDDDFWVGDAWEGNFYLSLSDFNYIDATQPDDDWGYDDVPYYFRVTLTYHPGASHP